MTELQVTTLIVVFITVMVASVLGIGALEASGALQEAFARLDAQSVRSTVTLMQESGSSRAELVMESEYDVSVDSGQLQLGAGFLPSPVSVDLPARFSYSLEGGSQVTTKEICVEKNGLEYTIGAAPCGDYSACEENACRAISSDGTPVSGYYCRNGVYTDEGFFTHYYSSGAPGCGEVQESFAEVNRFNCPDRLGASGDSDLRADATCVMTATWRCSSGDVSVSIDVSGDTVLDTGLECSGEIEHERFSATKSVGTGTHTAVGRVEMDGQTSSKEENIQMAPY